MKQFRFMKEKDTIVVEASNRKVAEKRAYLRGGDFVGNVLISVPENSTVKKHYPTGKDQIGDALVSSGAITPEQKAKVEAI